MLSIANLPDAVTQGHAMSRRANPAWSNHRYEAVLKPSVHFLPDLFFSARHATRPDRDTICNQPARWTIPGYQRFWRPYLPSWQHHQMRQTESSRSPSRPTQAGLAMENLDLMGHGKPPLLSWGLQLWKP